MGVPTDDKVCFPCSLLLVGVYSMGSLDLKGVLQSFGPETSGGK